LPSTRLAAACLLAVIFAPRAAQADTQIGSALTTGAVLTETRLSGKEPYVAYHLGARADVLLLRSRAEQMAVGPYVDVATAGFDTFEWGGGLEWLVPAFDTSLILSAGGFARTSSFGLEPGAEATIFWGARSFNYHSAYSPGLGLFLQGRYGFGDGRQGDAILGVQVDFEYLALPFLFAYEAIRR
jgi:hypothetical protein